MPLKINFEHRSPHHKARTRKPTLVVIHASAGKSDAGDISWIVSPQSKVSYHYLVGRDGEVYELVSPERVAYHAGVSEWKGEKHCNSYSIGVAWANRNDGAESLTGAQLKSMRELLDWLSVKHPTLKESVTHKDVAPNRKSDPEQAPNFYKPDWCGPL